MIDLGDEHNRCQLLHILEYRWYDHIKESNAENNAMRRSIESLPGSSFEVQPGANETTDAMLR